MPKWLKAYTKENDTYPHLLNEGLTRPQVKVLIATVCRAYGYKLPNILFAVQDFNYYWWEGKNRPEQIHISERGMNTLAVLHELGHLIHQHEYKARWAAATEAGQPNRLERPHGPAFNKVVAELAAGYPRYDKPRSQCLN